MVTTPDVKCPYCDEGQEINHDDGYGYDEGTAYQQECGSCEKTFAFSTTIVLYYRASKADCLNGSPHDLRDEPRLGFPECKRCRVCDEEERGPYDEKWKDKLEATDARP
jgi:hypothetical protein